jgi:hypothetical protein
VSTPVDRRATGGTAADPAELVEEPVDARLVAGAVAAWLSCAVGLSAEPALALALAVALVLVGLVGLHRLDGRLVVVLLTAGAGLLVAGLRLGVSDAGPVPDLAKAEAVVDVELTVTSDPRTVTGAFGDMVVLSARLTR